MVFQSILLFFSALLPGSAAFFIPTVESKGYNFSLIFSGAFLFSITVIHLLPDIFSQDLNAGLLGLFILIGFYFQQILEFFTAGVEHGHMHPKFTESSHAHSPAFLLIIALCVHAFLEGTLLTENSPLHARHGSGTILLGIILHKVPAGFALMSILRCQYQGIRIPLLGLITFSLASPLGVFISNLGNLEALPAYFYPLLFSLVAGSFLNISTTIFVESAPSHGFKAGKFGASILGALAAIVLEFLI